jgi:hypothetical protein
VAQRAPNFAFPGESFYEQEEDDEHRADERMIATWIPKPNGAAVTWTRGCHGTSV